jgi:hypothetical protein
VSVADKSTQLLVEALTRAVGDPTGLPLHAGKSSPGLFPSTTAAKALAQRCKEEELVRVVRTESRGKAVQEVCAITDKGLAYLSGHVSPHALLKDLVRAVEAREAQLAELVGAARQAQAGLDGLKGIAEKVLRQLDGAAGDWTAAALEHLKQRQAAEDCSLPELYRAARQARPSLTLGEFHDGLRQLAEAGKIYLHPWTGPLYALPEPPCALLVGHEVAYYASVR